MTAQSSDRKLQVILYWILQQDLKATVSDLRHSEEAAKEQVQNLMKRLQEEKQFYTMNRDTMRAELDTYKVTLVS